MNLRSMDVWVFGYGSLIWRVDFPIEDARPAYIDGWSRRFWQGSTDHRGVPGAPGRVVTLIEAPDEHCWGMAYKLPWHEREEALEHLDYREKGGYERLDIPIHFKNGDGVTGLLYHAMEDNPNFLGPADLHEIAEQILNSHGPSGANAEYLLELEMALRAMDADDDHVYEIATLVRAKLNDESETT